MSATNRMADVHWHCSVQRPGLTKLEHVGRRGYPCSNLFAALILIIVGLFFLAKNLGWINGNIGSIFATWWPALLVAVFESAGGTICPTGYDGAIGPALLTGAVAVGIGTIVAAFAPGQVSPR